PVSALSPPGCAAPRHPVLAAARGRGGGRWGGGSAVQRQAHADRACLSAAPAAHHHGQRAGDRVLPPDQLAYPVRAAGVHQLGPAGRRRTRLLAADGARRHGDPRVAPDALDLAGVGRRPGGERVVVDDGSRDGTAEIVARVDDPRVGVFSHPRNRGKGAAIRTAAENATGEYMVILDADLEYDPEDIPRLLEPVLDGRATVVYGNRSFGSHSSFSFWYVMGNKAVTTAANVLFNCYLGDLETCFKLIPVALYRSLDVRSQGFGMEAEVTGKLLRRRVRP